MKAIELINKYVKEDKVDDVAIIAIDEDKDKKPFWWHVHHDEELPDKEGIVVCISIK